MIGYIYSYHDDLGFRMDGIESSESYIRRMAELNPDTVYFYAERGLA